MFMEDMEFLVTVAWLFLNVVLILMHVTFSGTVCGWSGHLFPHVDKYIAPPFNCFVPEQDVCFLSNLQA